MNISISFDHSSCQEYKKGDSRYPHIRSVWGRGTPGGDMCVFVCVPDDPRRSEERRGSSGGPT